MMWKGAASLFSAGVLAGALALVLVQRIGQPSRSGAGAGLGAPAEVQSTDQIAALRLEYDQRISALTTENKALQADKKALEKAAAEFPVSTPDRKLSAQGILDETVKRARGYAKQRDIKNLLAAGYSMEHIEYLQRRAEELAEQFRQSNTDQVDSGLGPLDPAKYLGLVADPDFALRDEIGDAEYERYLTARKRPTTVGVADVLEGSIAERAGIMPGDEIVMYNNTRVFNSGQLAGLSQAKKDTDSAGALVPITVRRNGQMTQMRVTRGLLGVREPLPDIITDVGLPPSPF